MSGLRLLATVTALALLAGSASAQEDCSARIGQVTDALRAHYPGQASAAASALRGNPSQAEMPRAGPAFETESEESAADAGIGGDAAPPPAEATDVEELSEAEVKEVVELREQAMESYSAGKQQDCQQAIDEAEAMLFAE